MPEEKARTTLTPEELALQQAARDRLHEWWFAKGQHLTKTQVSYVFLFFFVFVYVRFLLQIKNTTLLLDASVVGNTEAARVLLEKGVRVLIEREQKSETGRVKYTALHYAAEGGHRDVVCLSVVIPQIVRHPFHTRNPSTLL